MQSDAEVIEAVKKEVAKITPARKSLIRQARLFPKKTVIWIQGILIWKHKEEQIALDDGSGIARIDVSNMEKRDVAAKIGELKVGNYLMVVGEMHGKYRGRRMGMRATTVRDITREMPMGDSMWNAEVVDSFLYYMEKSQNDNKDVTT